MPGCRRSPSPRRSKDPAPLREGSVDTLVEFTPNDEDKAVFAKPANGPIQASKDIDGGRA